MSLLIIGLTINCSEEQAAKAQKITFDQLFTNPGQYNDRYVTIEGFYFGGFEIIVLSEKKEVYEKLHQQQMMGPSERYGKVRVKRIFEYGGEYGHLGAYSYRIVPLEVELPPWSPPVR